MKNKTAYGWHRLGAGRRAVGLALLCLLTGVGRARGAGEPLSATFELHGGGRSGAPRSATVTLLWNGEALLEGDLQVEIVDGHQVVSRSTVTDLALAPGAQSFGVLLPPAGVYGSGSRAVARLSFREGKRVIPLADHACALPSFNERVLSLCYPLPVTGSDRVRQLAAAVRPDWLMPAPAAGHGRSSLRSGLCALRPDAFPSTPEMLCAFDVVVLTGAGVGKLRSGQLDALLAWVRGGGSVCVLNPGRLPADHQAFLESLFPDGVDTVPLSGSSPSPLFGPDGAPLGEGMALEHVGLGRAALLLDPALDLATLRERPEWRRLLCFVWQWRASQAAYVVAEGHWDDDAESTTTVASHGDSYQLRQQTKASQSQLQLQPLDLLRHTEYLSVLMPNDMSFVQIGHLALVLIVLVLLVGPVDYMLLKRLRLQRFTWFTVPLYVALATVVIVMMANHAMGRHDRQRQLCVLDTDTSGVPVRQNTISLRVPASHGTLREHVQHALVAPVSIGASGHGMDSASDENLLHIAGRYPHDFQMAVDVAQWRPMAWRAMTLRPTVAFPWGLPASAPDLWSAKGRKTFWSQFKEANPTLPQGAFILHGQELASLRNERWPASVGIGRTDPKGLVVLADAPRVGYFSVAASRPPAGDLQMEDLPMHDVTDPDQALLVLVWQEQETILMSRTPFHRRGARPSDNPHHAAAQRRPAAQEG